MTPTVNDLEVQTVTAELIESQMQTEEPNLESTAVQTFPELYD
jgi:hypothetical protein